jgi:biotin carboxyl carrier protein
VKYEVTLEGAVRTVDVRQEGGEYLISVDGGPARKVAAERGHGTRWRVDGASVDVSLDKDQVFVRHHGAAALGTAVDPRKKALSLGGKGGAGTLVTMMPGAVVRVLVTAGQAVHKGQVLVVIEAMKMENELRSAIDGTVAEVKVAAGQAVEAGTVLVVVAPA